jgi:hypothetical protein
MKKFALCLSALLLALSLSGVHPVLAQGSTGTQAPGTWVSSINIQNTGSGDATVTIAFYDSNGAIGVTFVAAPAIPAGGSRSYYVPAEIPGLNSGQYSVVISSDQPLQVVANSTSTGPLTSGAYVGIQSTELAKTLYFPGLYKNYFGFYSELALQNAETTQATVTITFFDQLTGGQVAQVANATIPGNASRVFALQDLSAVPSGNTSGLLSAQVTSDKNLAGVANIWNSAGNGQFSDYNAYTSGSTTVIYAPALYYGYFNFNSALTIQNIGSSAANIRVTYSNGTIENATLQVGQAKEYYQPNNPALPSGNTNGVFSAKVETLNGVPIVGLVSVNDGQSLASYNAAGLATANGSGCPVVLKEFFDYFSAETVQNVGTQATNITIAYASGQNKTFNNVPPNGTVNIIELANTGSVLPSLSSVSAVITSSNSQPLVTVVQENRITPQTGDTLLAYTCVAR